MKRLFNEGWKFWKSEYGTGYETAVKSVDKFADIPVPDGTRAPVFTEMYG